MESVSGPAPTGEVATDATIRGHGGEDTCLETTQ
jgi:hypothetical protein